MYDKVGEAIAASGVKREDLFVQTKLWRSYSGIDPKSKKPRFYLLAVLLDENEQHVPGVTRG